MSAVNSKPPARAATSAVDRALLGVIALGAGAVAALWTVGAVLSARTIFGSSALPVRDMQIGNAETPAFTEGLTAVTDARYESVAITIDSPSQVARWFLWAADAVNALAVIGVCLTLIWLCIRTRRHTPFGRSVTGAILMTAALTVVGGIGGQVLAAMGRAEIVAQLGPHSTAGGSADRPAWEGFAGFAVSVDLAPLGIALALGVVAVAFHIGERMQRDTEGLV